MSDVVLSPITSGYNLTKVNDNFDKIEQKINEEMLHLVGGNNVMLQNLDMNSHTILNIGVDLSNPDSLLTVEVADERYYNVDGDTLTGPMSVNGQLVTGLPVATAPSQPVRKDQLDGEAAIRAAADSSIRSDFTAGDASLQAQINGTNPPMGSAFSTISWHDQVITNSITIPDNKNAWSFGPNLTIASGQVVTIPANSFWTIANGQTTGGGTLTTQVPAPLDFGEV